MRSPWFEHEIPSCWTPECKRSSGKTCVQANGYLENRETNVWKSPPLMAEVTAIAVGRANVPNESFWSTMKVDQYGP
jgi:hypothetical protein